MNTESERIKKEIEDNLYFQRCEEISHLKKFFSILIDFDFLKMGSMTNEEFLDGKNKLQSASDEYEAEQERIMLNQKVKLNQSNV